MEEIRFHVVVDSDGIIRPPAGIDLPVGELEVTVRPRRQPPEAEAGPDPLAATRSWLLGLAADAEAHAPPLPEDLAEHHDHYAHGKPRP
jgi:hypothetical protein